ncbi:hypothetical protein ADIARSV_3176 [Arcticibacter svalbardensis MN12-7]|uniref:Exosortase N n=1 Tax=Arcticibacter svalbardensis MN12-7 TaxID=1150600 RepID=R9GPC8_9SPHI|nr:exosortase N [Arcticibacter svalbardensis]EOR93667.1 hypothetical protein ADIARSV_3176 [Arcticibacter svalbardensis MN12-7]
MISLKLSFSYPAIAGYLLSLLYFMLIIGAMNSYYLWNANLFIGLLLAPYICSFNMGKFSIRYLIPAVVFIVLALFIPVRTTVFIALLFSFLFFLENYIGTTSSMLLFLLLLISPIFNYLSNVIGFPIRLYLSDFAAIILGWAGSHTQAYGNIIVQGNNEFAVDQACAGLNMLATSLIICLFIIAYYQKRTNKRFSFVRILTLLVITTGLNMICNLIRIVLLVQFKIPAESIYHDLIGILCLLVYVMIPLMLLIKRASGIAVEKHLINIKPFVIRYPILHLLLLTTALFVALNLKRMDQIAPSIQSINLEGYQKNVLSNGILKFENHEGLVYLKSGAFYAADHDPMVCWRGSGYTFKSIKKTIIGSIVVYTGILEKGGDKIYSSWWFDNGKIKTINQFNWRWRAAKGERNFYLVNVNARNASSLKRITTSLLSKNLNL